MNITQYNIHEYISFIEKIKNITLLEDINCKIYEKSTISTLRLDPKYLSPPQRYILSNELKIKLDLYYSLLKKEINIFNLTSAVNFKIENEWKTILPIIIEEFIINGKVYQVICDGMHRCYLAMMRHEKITALYIRGGLIEIYKYYAYPLINGWNDVKIIDKLTPEYIKKWHRIENNKKLYRNFDSVFKNCSAPRGNNYNV